MLVIVQWVLKYIKTVSSRGLQKKFKFNKRKVTDEIIIYYENNVNVEKSLTALSCF